MRIVFWKSFQTNLTYMPPKRRRPEGGRKRKKHKSDKPEQSRPGDGVRGAGYTPIVKDNASFVKYYQGLGVVPAEEWDQFMSTMRRPLPSTFRITGTRHLATAVRECLQHRFFAQLIDAVQRGGGGEGEELAPPTPLPWYPNNLAWHIPLSKAFIRKSPEVSKFHSFLVNESDQGNISRQEAVSMIPPLVLDVLPHHKVLDMCAAPGSKTAQLIEMIHADDGGSSSAASLPAGVVVANDADNKRCYMLIHQAKRLKSPCFMVTNHDASVFPMLYYHDENDVRRPLHYDRVLCDVPCSGDGTMRKNPTIWRSWNPALGVALHKLQLRILTRGLELLQPGGRLVYSTCSLNPMENEAVVSTTLQLCKGSIKLVDVSQQLPGLKTVCGMTTWKVMNKKLEWITVVPEERSSSTPPSLFPPDSSLLPQLNLHRCLRVLPHHQDTGGFFIAVLHKSDWLPWQRRPQRASGATSHCDTSTREDSGIQRPSVLVAESGDDQERGEGEGGRACEEENVQVDGRGEEGLAAVETDILQDTGVKVGGNDSGSRDVDSARKEEEVKMQVEVEEGDGGVVTTVGGEGEGVTGAEVERGLCRGDGEGGSVGQESGPAPGRSAAARPTSAILGRPAHRQGSRGRVYREDPYVFMTEDSEVWKLIKPYYGLGDSFPCTQLLTRSVAGKKRNIYLTSALVKELLRRNEFHVKFINVGVKVLARCDNYNASCPFRLCQEGIESLVPFVTNSKLSLTLDDLVLVLKEPNPLSVHLSQDTQDSLTHLGVGPALFDYVPDRSKQSISTTYDHPIYLSGWIARKSVRLYVDKKYRCHYLAMLGHEPPQNMSLASVSGRKDDERDEMEEWRKEQEEGGGGQAAGRGGGEEGKEVVKQDGGEKGEEVGGVGEKED